MLADDVTTITEQLSAPTPTPSGAVDAAWTRLIDLVTTRAPLLRVHPTDAYHPASVHFFLPRAALGILDRPSATPDRVLNSVKVGEVTVDALLGQQRLGQRSSTPAPGQAARTDFRLYVERAPRPAGQTASQWKAFCEETARGALPTARYYACVRAAPQGGGQVDAQYWLFYPYNGRMGTPPFHGEHEGDWEHVTVRVLGDGQLAGVYCSAHYGEGRWYASAPLTLVDGHPVVYSARHSHASYPFAGTVPRGPLPDDETADGGPEVRTWERLDLVGVGGRVLKGHEWLLFTGRWGRDESAPFGPAFRVSWAGDGY
jgi:hypothetical protein